MRAGLSLGERIRLDIFGTYRPTDALLSLPFAKKDRPFERSCAEFWGFGVSSLLGFGSGLFWAF